MIPQVLRMKMSFFNSFFIVLITTVMLLVFISNTKAAETFVPADYNTIQSAIDSAEDGM